MCNSSVWVFRRLVWDIHSNLKEEQFQPGERLKYCNVSVFSYDKYITSLSSEQNTMVSKRIKEEIGLNKENNYSPLVIFS